MSSVPVSIATDITYGATVHLTYANFIDVWDSAAPMGHHPGHGLGRHSMGSRVRHKGAPIVLDGHDLGPWLPHLGMNFFFHGFRSSRKVNWSTSKVSAHKKPVACVDDDHMMVVCGDPLSHLSGYNGTNSSHTVFVGMTPTDELKGWLNWFATNISEFYATLLQFAGVPGKGDLVTSALNVDVTKMVIGGATSLMASTIVSWSTGWKEPISMKLETGTAYLNTTGDLIYDPRTGDVSFKDKSTAVGKEGSLTSWAEKL